MGTKVGQRRAWLLLLGLLVLAYALLSKWNKWPFGTALLIVSAILSWAGALVHWYRHRHSAAGVLGSATAMFVTYVVWRMLYWEGAMIVGAAALVLAMWVFVLWWRHDRAHSRTPALAGIVLACTIGLMAVPVHALYHYMFFETPGAQRFMHSGVGHWYRYGWFLYQDGHFARSASMIDRAMVEVEQNEARTGHDGEWLLVQLRATRSAIEARTWGEFRQLHVPQDPPQ